MSALKVRKNNVGRAIIRFLIGAIILAVLVLVFQQMILKKNYDTTKQPDGSTTIADAIDQAEKQGEFADNTTPEGNEDESFTEPYTGEEDEPFNEPADEGEDDFFGDEGNDEFDVEPEDGEEIATPVEAEPVVTPTPVPTATPVPTPTAVPASLYAQVNKKAKDYPWKTDRDTRVKNGITEITIGTSENGGSVVSMTAFCFGNWEGFNGKDCMTFVEVKDQKKNCQYYPVTVAPGATGIEHTVRRGKNMDMADFTCVIDVSSYPDGTYSLGSCVRFKVSGNTYSFGYTFGEAYDFTVVGGYITAMGGVEN